MVTDYWLYSVRVDFGPPKLRITSPFLKLSTRDFHCWNQLVEVAQILCRITTLRVPEHSLCMSLNILYVCK